MTLSADPRTTKLIQLAVRNMTQVDTLRIIFGHPHLNDALLRCFFAKDRDYVKPIRRLWLENCRISAGCNLKILDHPLDLPLELDFKGLKSIRFRRMPLRPGRDVGLPTPSELFVHSRGRGALGNGELHLQDGAGGHYLTPGTSAHYELSSFYPIDYMTCVGETGWDSKVYDMFQTPHAFDDEIYRELAEVVDLPAGVQSAPADSWEAYVMAAYRGRWLDPGDVTEYEHERDRYVHRV